MHVKKILVLLILIISTSSIIAQDGGNYYEGKNIHAVYYVFTNPITDSIKQGNIRAKIEKVFPVYPQTNVRTILLDAYTAKVRQLPEIANAEYEIRQSQTAEIDIYLNLTLSETAKAPQLKSGILAGGKDFPMLYLDNRSLLTTKYSISEMLYSNSNAWYGRPDAMLAGNPLTNDHPAGKGYTGWIEGWASAGIYGITTLSVKKSVYLYGGTSFIMSGSAGRELFTDESRFHGAFDDAYVGLVGTSQYKKGNRFTYNFSAGRQQFSIGQGFIIRNTASNGDNRAALQLNPRWAADFLGLASFKYNNLLVQFFNLNPDELPAVDSKTIIRGINLDLGVKDANKLGASVMHVPTSSYKYYTPTGDVYGRQGLWIYNLRYYSNQTPGKAGLFYKAEFAYGRNSNFDMSALAGYGEVGWSFTKSKGTPVISYRYAYFSGDDPSTKRFEKWDPLLTGGNGEEWVLGANHFKIVQNSNIIVNKLQVSTRPSNRLEIVPQFLYMYAAQKNNIGGNPALSYMPQKEYGYEVNLSWKYFHSRRWYFHGHFAYTVPGKGVKEALSNDANSWFSAMVFFRYYIY